ncbi:RNA-binding S4 domain-containing protein [Vibrio sp. WJH972]
MSSDQEEIEVEAIGIEVDSQPIELYKVLKIANAVSGGGEAKYAISEGYVAVNGELEIRKRRKLFDGDLIEFNQEYYLVICDQPVDNTPKEKVPSTPRKSAPVKNSKKAKKASASKSDTTNKKRNPKEQVMIEAATDGGRSRLRFGE